jgi:hypothetical protein
VVVRKTHQKSQEIWFYKMQKESKTNLFSNPEVEQNNAIPEELETLQMHKQIYPYCNIGTSNRALE